MTRSFPPLAGATLCVVSVTYILVVLAHGSARRPLHVSDASARVFARELSDSSAGVDGMQTAANPLDPAASGTVSSLPTQELVIERPGVFLATAGRSSDIVPVTLTNSSDRIYTYQASLKQSDTNFSVSGCTDGFVRARSHCVITVAYRPVLPGTSTTELALILREVAGSGTETLTVPLSGFATAGSNSGFRATEKVSSPSEHRTHRGPVGDRR